jgi:hypothetical protein
MKKTGWIVTVSLLVGAALLNGSGILRAAEKEKRTLLRVGVYDSRAIAIAHYNSDYWNKILTEKRAELEQAKKEGNAEKVRQIEAWGPAQQTEAHLKGFSTAPVHELLVPVKDKLPDVAQKCGVDVIVSKWEFDYQSPDAEVMDITDQLAALYNPSEKTLNWIRQTKDIAPLPEKEILEHQD